LRKRVKIFFLFFALVGAVVLIMGFIWVRQTQNFLDRSLEANGVVIDLSWKQDSEGSWYAYPVLRFVDERTGEEITVVSTFGSVSPIYSVGQEVCIIYDSQNPYNAKIKSFWDIWFGPIIVTGLSCISLSIGLTPFVFDFRKRRMVQYLKTHGEIVHGKVKHIFQDISHTEEGQSPWHIIVQWMNPASGRVYVFRSDPIWYDPSDFVKIGEELEIRIDPKNPKKHWINIDILPKGEN